MTYVKVATPSSLEQLYEYKVPKKLSAKIQVGSIVFVLFGKRKIHAFVMSIHDIPEYDPKKIKEIISIHDFCIPNNLIKLSFWLSSYYLCPLGRVLSVIIPSTIRKNNYKKKIIVVYKLNSNIDVKEKIQELSSKPACLRAFNILLENNQYNFSQKKWLKLMNISSQTFKKLLEFQCLVKINEYVDRDVLSEFHRVPTKRLELNEYQQNALEHISQNLKKKSKSLLLHGVTGSGKTEVFLRAIEQCIHNKEQVIILVPEITLAHQTVHRLYDRFW